MNIVVVTPSWPQFANPNGIATYYANLVPALIKLGHSVHIVTFKSSEKSENIHVIDHELSLFDRLICKVKSCFDPAYRHYIFGVKGISQVLRDIDRKAPIDVVQMEDSFGWHYEVQKKFSFPVVVRLHGPYFLNDFSEVRSVGVKKRIQREGRAFQAARYITSPSKSVLDITRNKYGGEWMLSEVVVNSMNVFRKECRWQLPHVVKNQILFVGRFDDHKGGDILLHAFFKVRLIVPDVQLVFVGPDKGLNNNGGKITVDQFLKEHGYDEKVAKRAIQFLGLQDKKTINAHRQTSHVTVVASRYETFGNVALEAMACGSPLVCSDSGALPEVVQDGETGLLFKSEDCDDLAAKIIRLLSSSELAEKLSKHGVERVSNIYSPHDTGVSLVDFFKKVVALHDE